MEQVESYYRAVSVAYVICMSLFNAWCFIIWIRPFMADRKKAVYAGAVYGAGMLVMNAPFFLINAMMAYGIVTGIAFVVMYRLDREYAAQKLFLVIAFFCMRWQAWRIVYCISNEVYLLIAKTLWISDSMPGFRSYVIQQIGDLVLGCGFMYGAVRCLLWAYKTRREDMSIKEFILLVMPSVSGVFAYGIIRYYNYIYERDSGKNPFDLYGSYDLIILFYTLTCFVTIFVTTYVYRQWKNERQEDKRREVFSRQVEDLESHIKEVERIYQDMRSMRHDMGNHLMTLQELYRLGEYDEAGKYAGALKLELQDGRSDIVSGNPVTDVILSARKKEMEEKGIRFACDFHYPGAGTVNALDVSIVLHNALSNAVEAIERERNAKKSGKQAAEEDTGKMQPAWVSVRSHCMKNMFIIEVINQYAGEIKVDESDGLPHTNKTGEGHGFGLANIRHVAGKYYGDIEIGKEVYEGQMCFVLRVMLQLA